MTVLQTARGVLGVFKDIIKDIIVDDLRSHPLVLTPWTNAAVNFGAMVFFGIDLLKAAVIAGVIALAIMNNYGRRTLIRGGIAVLFFTLAVWAEAIPAPAVRGKMAHSLIAELRPQPPPGAAGNKL
jgi:hypothetical protein